jgi:hypothetical protein
MRSLTRILNAVQRLIEHTEESVTEVGDDAQVESEPAMPLHLLDVRRGSARYGVLSDSAPAALKTIAETGRYLQDPSRSEWEPEILSPIREISAVAKTLKSQVEFRRPGKNGELLATITPQSYEEMSRVAFITGDSTVSGYLERVGGATSWFCGLRLPDQSAKMLICPVDSQDLVRQLGQHVYENVRVSGAVTWFRRNWRVRRVYVKSFEPTKEGSILQALDRIYEAGGKDWNDVQDVDGLLSEIRRA